MHVARSGIVECVEAHAPEKSAVVSIGIFEVEPDAREVGTSNILLKGEQTTAEVVSSRVRQAGLDLGKGRDRQTQPSVRKAFRVPRTTASFIRGKHGEVQRDLIFAWRAQIDVHVAVRVCRCRRLPYPSASGFSA